MSNIKHHRYLSVDGRATKKAVTEVIEKFSIHGKYEVSKKFKELVETFLFSFDFEHHPQYDLQWSLLSFLLNLSNETNKSELQCLDNLRSSRGEHSFSTAIDNQNEHNEDLDWGQYLKEGQEDFFADYHSQSDSVIPYHYYILHQISTSQSIFPLKYAKANRNLVGKLIF